jgi:hypothetical protein
MLWEWLGYGKAGEAEGAAASTTETPKASKSGSKAGKGDTPAPPKKHVLDEDPALPTPMTPEEEEREKARLIRQKLREAVMEQPHASHSVTYDSLSRATNRILMEGHSSSTMEFHDGLQLCVQKQFQNTQVQSRWSFGNPQQANWESNVTMNGFNSVVSVTWSTLGRAQLMYQRMFNTGGLLVTQFMMQPTPMGNHGTLFALMQYPWVNHGCSTATFLKGQHVSLTHCSRLIRGVHVGANFNYDLNTHASTLTYAAATTSSDKNTHWVGEWKPSSGEWKLGTATSLWAHDAEVAAQIELKEGRQGMSPNLVLGIRKPLIGGGCIHSSLANFKKIKLALELPYGLDRVGSRIQVQYGVQLDVATGGLKHGLTLNI